MYLYNAWLPPAVAEETKREAESFASVVRSVKEAFRDEDPDSVFATLKWISVIDLFLKAKSEVSAGDVNELVEFGLKMVFVAENKLYAQVRWGDILVKLIKKHKKKLILSIQWRPFYDCLIRTHFKRNTGPEGWKLRQRHFEMVTSLVRSCRKFFPAGAASEIWSEFRTLMENPWHNSVFEGSGFMELFLPINVENHYFFTSAWVKECLDLWNTLPNSQFWDVQWASIIARCIKKCKTIDWDEFLPIFYVRYLNTFEIPISSSLAAYPFPLEAPRNTRFLFSSKSGTPAKAIAKSIVYLLRPGGLGQEYFERLANLLEQYYHPSNGGRWTYSLERFLRHLVISFQKRLQAEQLNGNDSENSDSFLGKLDRACFVKVVLKLIDRGQYSKNDSLSETVAVATSALSYIEPSLVLPFVASRFQLALETMTATHQLKTAVTSVAYAGRALCLASVSSEPQVEDHDGMYASDLIALALSNALLGMDANDPPKTLASMQLIGSIFSNLSVGGYEDVPAFLPIVTLSEWLDEFFCRLFSLLQHLEASSVVNEGLQTSVTSGTFLVEDNPYYFCMLQVLLGKLSKPLFDQSLRKISKFVNSSILPGATAEVGLLCLACVHANPKEAAIHLIQPILMSILSSFRGSEITRVEDNGTVSGLSSAKATLSPALETSLEYLLKVLAMSINYMGSVLLDFRNELKETIASSFKASSWKVNIAGDYVLRGILGSLVLYYPIDQYKPYSSESSTSILEEWHCSKTGANDKLKFIPKWHIPSEEELSFANELLDLHFRCALDDLVKICEANVHNDTGNEKELLKTTLLRIYSSLQGVMSCLPDMRPYKNKSTKDDEFRNFIAGAIGLPVGSSELRETAAYQIHMACKYLFKERSDDSTLLILVIRIMDALANYGNLEYEEWANHIHAWKLESAAIVEPPCNYIVSSHAQGKRRPIWALIDKAYMHNTWRSSQSSYHRYRTDSSISPSEHLLHLVDDLMELCLHNYETVRSLAGRSLSRILKRWPSLTSKCVLTLTSHLQDPKTPEHVVLGSCRVLSTQPVLRHLTTDASSFSSFIVGLLSSSHHESLKAQKAITELFVKYNIHFSGISWSFFKASESQANGLDFVDLISKISSLSFDSTGLHWRYNLMANRVLLLLTLASRSQSYLSSKILGETAGHFLRNLKSQLPQSRILAISALNTLLQVPSHKVSSQDNQQVSEHIKERKLSSIEGILNQILMEDGFFKETLNSLSHVHIITDNDSSGSKGNQGASSLQSLTDKAITYFYFDFSASWPRTPNWIYFLGNDFFYSNFARIFKRLIQECGTSVLNVLQNTIEEFSSATERSKQCVAAEVMAGILHSDANGILEAWDNWMMPQLQKIIISPSVESIPDWAAFVRYAVTGKGKYGTRIPILRQRILECLASPIPQTMATNVVAKRYAFLAVALSEISPPKMATEEIAYHYKLLAELLGNISHSSAQVREAIGVTLSILCSNLRLSASSGRLSDKGEGDSLMIESHLEDWPKLVTEGISEAAENIQNLNEPGASEPVVDSANDNGSNNLESKADVRRMETIFHFVISLLKSGRSSYLLDVIVQIIYPVISLQEISNKDLSTLAKAAFELLKWAVIPRPFLETTVSIILSAANDPNWRTRSTSLTYLHAFMYRHTFTLSGADKLQIWNTIEKLLSDNQVEVREHAAAVLASLMKGGDEDLSRAFRDRSYPQAREILNKQRQRNLRSGQSLASTHGAVLALAASVLSVPYDMPSWLPDHVTLLARFISEPSPIKSTVTKAVAEFRRTHADTWNFQKDAFTEEQLEVLADTSSSNSYFA